MTGRFFVVVFLAGLISCSVKDQLPKSVLPAEKMEALLWDLLRAEQFVSNYIALQDTNRSAHAQGPMLYDAILKKHGTTDSLFRLSMEYYKQHPQLLFPILDSLGLRPDLAPTPMVGSPDSAQQPVDPTIKPMAY